MSKREELETQSYEDLGEMMQAYAQQAIRQARGEHHVVLEFSVSSIEKLEQILTAVASSPEPDVDYETRLWGAYFGEFLRALWGGEWAMSSYPGMVAHVPALTVRGSQLYPLMKVYRRLTIGEAESLNSFFAMVQQRLGAFKAPN